MFINFNNHVPTRPLIVPETSKVLWPQSCTKSKGRKKERKKERKEKEGKIVLKREEDQKLLVQTETLSILFSTLRLRLRLCIISDICQVIENNQMILSQGRIADITVHTLYVIQLFKHNPSSPKDSWLSYYLTRNLKWLCIATP